MTANGRTPAWRRRVLLVALVLMGAVVLAPGVAPESSAQDGTQLTLLYHGAVSGKIAPCG